MFGKMMLVVTVLGLGACASADLPRPAGSAADPSSATPVDAGIGAARDDFDPERAAPSGAANDTGHDHGQMGHDHAQMGHGQPAPSQQQGAATTYTCPHHPEVQSSTPGICPKCKMDLVPGVPSSAPKPATQTPEPAGKGDHGGHP